MLILADWAVAISFYSLLNLLHPVWKSLSSSVVPLRWHVDTGRSAYYNKDIKSMMRKLQ